MASSTLFTFTDSKISAKVAKDRPTRLGPKFGNKRPRRRWQWPSLWTESPGAAQRTKRPWTGRTVCQTNPILIKPFGKYQKFEAQKGLWSKSVGGGGQTMEWVGTDWPEVDLSVGVDARNLTMWRIERCSNSAFIFFFFLSQIYDDSFRHCLPQKSCRAPGRRQK